MIKYIHYKDRQKNKTSKSENGTALETSDIFIRNPKYLQLRNCKLKSSQCIISKRALKQNRQTWRKKIQLLITQVSDSSS